MKQTNMATGGSNCRTEKIETIASRIDPRSLPPLLRRLEAALLQIFQDPTVTHPWTVVALAQHANLRLPLLLVDSARSICPLRTRTSTPFVSLRATMSSDYSKPLRCTTWWTKCDPETYNFVDTIATKQRVLLGNVCLSTAPSLLPCASCSSEWYSAMSNPRCSRRSRRTTTTQQIRHSLMR